MPTPGEGSVLTCGGTDCEHIGAPMIFEGASCPACGYSTSGSSLVVDRKHLFPVVMNSGCLRQPWGCVNCGGVALLLISPLPVAAP